MKDKKENPVDGNKKQDAEINEIEELNLSDENIEDPAPKAVNPRDAMMQSVVVGAIDERNQRYADEGLEAPDVRKAAPLEPDPEVEELIDPEPEVVDNPNNMDNTSIVQRDGQSYIKVKVDGVEQEVPVKDMVTHYQKNENADAKLGQANQMLNQAREIQQSSASTPPDDSREPVVDKTAVNTALNKLYDGDVDEASEELSNIISQQQAPQVDVNALVDQRMAAINDHNDLKSSWQRFAADEEFKTIVNDKALMRELDSITEILRQDQAFMADNPSYEDIFTEAGRRTNKWVETLTPATSPEVSEDIIESRRDRKLSKPQAVNSRTVRRGPKPTQKAPTREDNIAKMAKARGQTVYN